jgi:HEAT repeat protein
MSDNIEKIPLDARLLSFAIIELNISRRNVAIYPRDHPSVERSLSNAFKFLKQLFDIRSEITLAIAKDTLIIDHYHLDKKNPVFSDFARTLSRMNIAYVTLKKGLTKDELYRFHRFITEKTENMTVQNLKEVYRKYDVTHADIGFIDYRKFITREDHSAQQAQKAPIWERYIYGLIEGTLQGEAIDNEVKDIPPELLAQLINKVSDRNMKEESYDKVITAYMKSSSESMFSGQDLKRLLSFIERLRPELKERFLSSTVKTFSEDTQSAYQSMKKMSVDEIERFLDTVNKHRISIPPALTSLIDKFSYNTEVSSEALYLEEELIEDDEFDLSSLTELFNEEKAGQADITKDLQEIQALLAFDASELKTSQLMEFENEFNEEFTDKRFHQIILELMVSRTVSADDYQACVNSIREQAQQLLWMGQYGQLLDALKILALNKKENRFPDMNSKALQYYHSPHFMAQVVESFRLLGRQLKKEVWMLCDYYDREIIPYLLDALIEEESQIVRRFLMDVLKLYGDKIIPEAVKRLQDDRWFVKRNMLYILQDTDTREVSKSIRPFYKDENPKVSVLALKCLLNSRDHYAIEIIRENLVSNSKEVFEQALTFSSSFKLKEVVGDLISLLKKQERTGADILDKIPIVKALGEIADPQALDVLREFASSKSIFLKKMLDQLKEEIYKTLKNYPYELVKDLVEAGIESKNDVIKRESLHLRRRTSE